MKCAECARLDAERERVEQAAAVACALLDNQFNTANVRQYMRLRTATHHAKLELSLVEMELKRHQRRHLSDDGSD